MPSTADKLQTLLNEARILVLGTQVLLGGLYESVITERFDRLAPPTQYIHLTGVGLFIVVLALLMRPAAIHHVSDAGSRPADLRRHCDHALAAASVGMSLGLGCCAYVALEVMAGRFMLAAALLTTAAAAGLWFGGLLFRRPKGVAMDDRGGSQRQPERQESLDTRLEHALVELRTVLPGAQAMLTFQFLGAFGNAFEGLPASSRWVHLASLLLVAVSILLLMTPAAFHRIVEHGETTQRQYRVSVWCLMLAMIVLAPGICGDIFVVVRKVGGSPPLAVAMASVMLLLCYAVWFVALPLIAGRRRPRLVLR